MAEILLQTEEIVVNRFQLQLSDLHVERDQRLLESLNASGGAGDDAVHFGEVRVERTALGGAAGNLVDDLMAKIVTDGVDSLQHARSLPMKTEDLNLAIHALRNRDNRFMKRGACNGKFFLQTAEEI